ncbi:BadF/BadG/BcrA/BcrD ATPase family protein [Glaciecola sp. MF2-115]|uniref:BadF/BadG/BcrA/BcrD ATPase family protein n=1 Tax=Glaciecola sp. MF2-115 TaxID=3384827 RepID=UPI0039A304D9
MSYFVGIDAGGTHCRASLYDDKARLLGSGKAGPANVFNDFASAMQQIEHAISLAISDSKIHTDSSNIVVGAGCAGGQTALAKEQLLKWRHSFKQFYMISDLHASCFAANKGDPCIVIITGTGSSIAHYQASNVAQYGGHGFFHGDDASGAWLGLSAVKLLLKSYDHIVRDDEFCSVISKELELDYPPSEANKAKHIDAILTRFKLKRATDYAVLAPIIVDLYKSDNKTARTLLEKGRDYLISVLQANKLSSDKPIFITGGLASTYQPLLAQQLAQEINIMQGSAQEGAMLYARLQAD